MVTSDRRRFIKTFAGGMAATAAFPSLAHAEEATERWHRLRLLGRDLAPDVPADEAFWTLVKDQFPLAPDLILMNAANLCPSPFPVQEVVFELTQDVDHDATFQNRSKFGALANASRAGLARYLGADPDEIAITRNTSSSNATVVNGLDFGPGDEVVLWDQNHPTNYTSWEVRSQRYGFTVKTVSTPSRPASPSDLIDAFESALTPSTRLLSFSHVSNTSGIAIDAEQLCALARARGIKTLVDGAQTFGARKVDLHAIGCDFYTGSAHKWFVGPKEAGVLYVRRDVIPELWATHVGVGWQGALERGAAKFEVLGQRDDGAVAAVAATVDFHETVGIDRADARVAELAVALKSGLRERFPNVILHTPEDGAMSGGVVVFEVPGMDVRTTYGRLYEEHRVGCAQRGGEFPGLRVCPHIYNTLEDVNRVVEAVAASV